VIDAEEKVRERKVNRGGVNEGNQPN